jgi:hypothetical protein
MSTATTILVSSCLVGLSLGSVVSVARAYPHQAHRDSVASVEAAPVPAEEDSSGIVEADAVGSVVVAPKVTRTAVRVTGETGSSRRVFVCGERYETALGSYVRDCVYR